MADRRPTSVRFGSPRGAAAAGLAEIWAARAWNVLNEGRPFSLVFPALALGAGTVAGLVPLAKLPLALAGGTATAAILAAFAFPLRTRALLWLAAGASLPLLEPWGAAPVLALALGAYAAFTLLLWGTLYYRLRTGAPWTNGLRFWRLVLTNSDPTSGNALEQIPKFTMALSAGWLLASEPTAGTVGRIAIAAAIAAALGGIAWRRFARRRLPAYPAADSSYATDSGSLADRVYVIVIDGCNRARLRQGRTPTIDRLVAEGTEYLAVEPAYPARTLVCFSSMLTGASPREHGMRSNFTPRFGVAGETVFDALERSGRSGRLVGIAHLLDAFPPEVVQTVTSVQPTSEIDHSLTRTAMGLIEREDPELLVLQLLAADQIGHVRGVRNREYLEQIEATDRRIRELLDWLETRGRLERTAVIVMADHGQGRGIGGHGHLDWGESPVPFVVWGAGAVAGATCSAPRSVLELAATISALLGIRPPSSARGRPLVPALEPDLQRPDPGDRALAIVVARDEEAALPGVLGGLPDRACDLALDVLVVDDGSRDATAALATKAGAKVVSHPSSLGLGAALRMGLERARRGGYRAAVYLDGDGEYDPAEIERLLEPITRGRAEYVLGSRFLGTRDGMTWHRALTNRVGSALLGALMETVITDAQTGYRAFGRAALEAARIGHDYNYAQVLTLSLWGAGILPEEVPISYRRRGSGRSFVRYPEYLARVAPAVVREWRRSRSARSTSSAAAAAASAYGSGEEANSGNAASNGPHGALGRSAASAPAPSRTST